ncbi:MAG: YfhO family protein [Candidatus Omnitrophica bacterium]|nr:YfhO family protein [Candidatus Omnitrophota bacterium]
MESGQVQNYGFISSLENILGANTFRLIHFDNLLKNLNAQKVRKLLNVKYVVLPKAMPRSYSAKEMVSDKEVLIDQQSPGGFSLMNSYAYSACENFLEGQYEVNYYLKVDNIKSHVSVAEIGILSCSDQIIVSRKLKGEDFKGQNVFSSFTRLIGLKDIAGLKFYVRYYANQEANLWLDRIEVKPLEHNPDDTVYDDRDSGTIVLENKDFLERISFIPCAYIAGGQDALGILRNDSFSLEKVILLDKAPSAEFNDAITANPYKETAALTLSPEIKITEYASDGIAFSMHAPQNGFILLSQIYYPGWQAEIDGVPAEVQRADYALSAIAVKKGAHQVRLYYLPWYWHLILAVSIISWLVTMVVIVTCIFRRRLW